MLCFLIYPFVFLNLFSFTSYLCISFFFSIEKYEKHSTFSQTTSRQGDDIPSCYVSLIESLSKGRNCKNHGRVRLNYRRL